jgi:hypothetical protein
VSLIFAVACIAFAVFMGGLAGLGYRHARHAMPVVRTFAVAAAVGLSLLHLLPEAVAARGWIVLVAAAAGMIVPAILERFLLAPKGGDKHVHGAATSALALGYAAVIAHQAGEGAAMASLASSGDLSLAVVLAIAAHTVPLAMVVAIRAVEVVAERGRSGRRGVAIGAALGGVVLATVAGALAGSLVGAERLSSMEPWVLATVAGILLHALWHDALELPSATRRGRVADAVAGLLGLGLAAVSIEEGEWHAPEPFGAVVAIALALAIVGRSAFAPAAAHDHDHAHHGD